MGDDLWVLLDDIDLWMTRIFDRNSANIAIFTVWYYSEEKTWAAKSFYLKMAYC